MYLVKKCVSHRASNRWYEERVVNLFCTLYQKHVQQGLRTGSVLRPLFLVSFC